MLKVLAAIGMIAATGGVAQADCVGSSTLSTCYDYGSGSSYTVQRFGDMTTTSGSNPRTGSTWSQTDQQIGGSTYSSGRSGSGRSWNSTTQDLGGGFSSRNGIDSRGRGFSQTCGPFSCD